MERSPRDLVDELLVLKAQDGESSAMDKLVQRWQRPLWQHARRLVDTDEAAWDVLQEAWMGIVRGLRRLNDPAHFRYWAYRIVTNKAADWVKQNARRRRREHELDEHQAAADPPGDDSERNVQRALADMPQAQRVVLTLHYLEGFGVAEMAAILDIAPGTVKSRLFHARRELRRKLKGERP